LIIGFDFIEIRIFSRDEKKQDDMRKIWNDPRIKYYIGDVRDYSSIQNAMQDVDYVFHAAALKQVPTCEFFPLEAVKTNILGSENVIRCSINNKVDKVICLSTDKAAYPINAMGISKAMMERLVMSTARGLNEKTSLIITRYGNVIGSRGSVVPLFFQQIQANGIITITDPNMTRFIMTLDDAIDLVLYAFKHGRNGDLFVKKSPSAKVSSIADAVVDISGKAVDKKYIGPRHSEKDHETLMTLEESIRSLDLGSFFRIPMDDRDLNYAKYDEAITSNNNLRSYCSYSVPEIEFSKLIEIIRNNYEFGEFD
jgi:UDP-glucose 4-epimerase